MVTITILMGLGKQATGKVSVFTGFTEATDRGG